MTFSFHIPARARKRFAEVRRAFPLTAPRTTREPRRILVQAFNRSIYRSATVSPVKPLVLSKHITPSPLSIPSPTFHL